MLQLARLTNHTFRILYLAVSPDGESIVTCPGDKTLRFWNVFTKCPTNNESDSVLNLFNKNLMMIFILVFFIYLIYVSELSVSQ